LSKSKIRHLAFRYSHASHAFAVAAALLTLSIGGLPVASAFPPPTVNVTDVDSGSYHTCWLLSTGNVDCHGNNGYGLGEDADYFGGDGVAVEAGSGTSCVVTGGGNVECWGENSYGQQFP